MDKYIVRDSAIEIYGGHSGKKSEVRWLRCIFKNGQEVSSQRMTRAFDTFGEARTFGSILYEQFQTPAFAELEADWNERHGL